MEHNLSEKYWNAETSLQEEQQLLNDMAGMPGPEGNYFAMIAEARKQKSGLSFDAVKVLAERQSTVAEGPRVLPLYRWIASAAAILVFVISGVGLWKYSERANTPVQMAETFDDPYKAYEEVREALAFVSSKLNKSQSEAMLNIKKAGQYADLFK
jgi:hypothetical protein